MKDANQIAERATKQVLTWLDPYSTSSKDAEVKATILAAIQEGRGIKTTEYAKGWDDHVAAVRAATDDTKRLEVIEGLRYIVESPPQEHGGFHPNAVQIAKDAITLLSQRPTPVTDDTKRLATEAAMLEIAANHLRNLRACNAPIGVFIEKLIPTDDTKRLYYELLYEVENKYEGESRHDTARRLIRQAQKAQMGTGAMKEEKP